MNSSDAKRIDFASKIIKTSPSSIYQAFLDPKALVLWLPPEGMKGYLDQFEAWEGGSYRMTLTYNDPDYTDGKSSADADIVQATFVALNQNQQIVQQIKFESEDPAFAGKMNMTWNFHTVPEGTEVTVSCENVPAGIQQDVHEEGLRSTLANLASYVES